MEDRDRNLFGIFALQLKVWIMISQHAWGRDREGAGSTRGSFFSHLRSPKTTVLAEWSKLADWVKFPSQSILSIQPAVQQRCQENPSTKGGWRPSTKGGWRPPPSSPLENPSSTPDTPPAPPSRHIDPAPGQGSPADLNVVTQDIEIWTK